MRTKKTTVVITMALALAAGWLLMPGAAVKSDAHTLQNDQSVVKDDKKSQGAPASVAQGPTEVERSLTLSTTESATQGPGPTASTLTGKEHDEAKHQSGIAHDCFESMRLGEEGKLPEVALSESELQVMKERTEEFEEKLVEEFERFIVSDDGQMLFDKDAITADFQAEVEAMEKLPQNEIESVSVESL